MHMSSWELRPLARENCPGYQLPASDDKAGRRGTRIQVRDQDSFDAALDLQPGTTVASVFPDKFAPAGAAPAEAAEDLDLDLDIDTDADTVMSNTSPAPSTAPLKPVAVLNLASEYHPGGGWEKGALAQEEALCYRSSLYLSLHRSYYPFHMEGGIYTPTCLLIRDALSRGHALLHPNVPLADLPITSIITVAALRRPEIDERGCFARPRDREYTKAKIRGVLRMAVVRGHSKIVLGALGCGAFGNPPEEVADCFVEVFEEEEFRGGWFEDIVFAVLDNAKPGKGGEDGIGNYGVFFRALNGLIV